MVVFNETAQYFSRADKVGLAHKLVKALRPEEGGQRLGCAVFKERMLLHKYLLRNKATNRCLLKLYPMVSGLSMQRHFSP